MAQPRATTAACQAGLCGSVSGRLSSSGKFLQVADRDDGCFAVAALRAYIVPP
jgi:hypothetical protein